MRRSDVTQAPKRGRFDGGPDGGAGCGEHGAYGGMATAEGYPGVRVICPRPPPRHTAAAGGDRMVTGVQAVERTARSLDLFQCLQGIRCLILGGPPTLRCRRTRT